jgi:succinate dehydrogenase flavin-adding protein (antitoxin of CptAB toxin-antitoxin module)
MDNVNDVRGCSLGCREKIRGILGEHFDSQIQHTWDDEARDATQLFNCADLDSFYTWDAAKKSHMLSKRALKGKNTNSNGSHVQTTSSPIR